MASRASQAHPHTREESFWDQELPLNHMNQFMEMQRLAFSLVPEDEAGVREVMPLAFMFSKSAN